MNFYEKEYLITSYECDENNILRLRSLFNLFQDLADNHADMIGVGHKYCSEHNLGWVGSACDLEITALPKWNDKVLLKTWPSVTNAVSAFREFEMIDITTNKTLVKASTQWVLLDLTRLRPQPILKHLDQIELIEKRAVDTHFEKLPDLPQIDVETPEIIRRDDIDLNHHVNNAVYPTWILDAFDTAFFEAHTLNGLKIRYRLPAKMNDSVVVQTAFLSDGATLHIIKSPDGKEFAKISACWNKTVK